MSTRPRTHCSVCLQGRASAQNPRARQGKVQECREWADRAARALQSRRVLDLSPRGWKVEAGRGLNNSGHCLKAVGHKRGRYPRTPGRNVDLDQRRQLGKYLSAAGGRGRKKASLCAVTCSDAVWAFPVTI